MKKALFLVVGFLLPLIPARSFSAVPPASKLDIIINPYSGRQDFVLKEASVSAAIPIMQNTTLLGYATWFKFTGGGCTPSIQGGTVTLNCVSGGGASSLAVGKGSLQFFIQIASPTSHISVSTPILNMTLVGASTGFLSIVPEFLFYSSPTLNGSPEFISLVKVSTDVHIDGLSFIVLQTTIASDIANRPTYSEWETAKSTTVNISAWEAAKSTTVNITAWESAKSTTVNISNWEAAKSTTVNISAWEAAKSTTVNISDWNTKNSTDMTKMADHDVTFSTITDLFDNMASSVTEVRQSTSTHEGVYNTFTSTVQSQLTHALARGTTQSVKFDAIATDTATLFTNLKSTSVRLDQVASFSASTGTTLSNSTSTLFSLLKTTASELSDDTNTINAVTNPVSWNSLKDVPAGFADGTDDGAGGGGGGVAVSSSPTGGFLNPTSTLVFVGGGVSSMTFGTDVTTITLNLTPKLYTWNMASLFASSSTFSPVEKSTGDFQDIYDPPFDDSKNECRSFSVKLSTHLAENGPVRFWTHWYPKAASTNNVIWEVKLSEINQPESWDEDVTIIEAAADAGQGTKNQITITEWESSIESLGWTPNGLVLGQVCRDGANGSDNLSGDAMGIQFSMEVPRR